MHRCVALAAAVLMFIQVRPFAVPPATCGPGSAWVGGLDPFFGCQVVAHTALREAKGRWAVRAARDRGERVSVVRVAVASAVCVVASMQLLWRITIWVYMGKSKRFTTPRIHTNFVIRKISAKEAV